MPVKIVLGLPEVARRHTGANVAEKIVEVFESFEIPKHKIGYFTLDNAAVNDTTMDFIGEAYDFNGRSRRGRCMGHIINLAAKTLLFGPDAEVFENQLEGQRILLPYVVTAKSFHLVIISLPVGHSSP